MPSTLPTIEQKVGQLFKISLPGPTLDAATLERFTRYHISNYIYFSRNLTDYRAIADLSAALQEVARKNCGIPALIAVDQEGGMVTRAYSGATHYPCSMALSAAGADAEMGEVGVQMGRQLKMLGMNLNNAPVVDVNCNPNNPVIGIRSYSDDAQRVAAMATAYIRGLQSQGVAACAKHFPGHGDVAVDSHLGLPRVDKPLDVLHQNEFVPFKAAIAAGVDSIMTAHIVYPALDPSGLPATLSRPILTDFLRGELGFQGLIITDAMDMKAIASNFGAGEAAVMAVNAGVDVLSTGFAPDTFMVQYDAVLAAVREGRIPMARLDDAYGRILALKAKLGLTFDRIPESDLVDHLPAEEALADDLSGRSITLLRDPQGLLPLSPNSRVLVVSPPPYQANLAENHAYAIKSFAEVAAQALGGEAFSMTAAAAGAFSMAADPTEAQIAEACRRAQAADIVVLGVYKASLSPAQTALLHALAQANPRLVVVALNHPYDLLLAPPSATCIAAWEYTARAMRSVIQRLQGQAAFTGVLPVKMQA